MGVRSMAIFQTDEYRRAYLQFLTEEAERFGVVILAWSLMTGIFLRESRGGGLQRINNIGIMSPEFAIGTATVILPTKAEVMPVPEGEPFPKPGWYQMEKALGGK